MTILGSCHHSKDAVSSGSLGSPDECAKLLGLHLSLHSSSADLVIDV